jgi:hypothetical protein
MVQCQEATFDIGNIGLYAAYLLPLRYYYPPIYTLISQVIVSHLSTKILYAFLISPIDFVCNMWTSRQISYGKPQGTHF